jgi:hypothetical protein
MNHVALTTLWQIGQLFDRRFNATLESADGRDATRCELLEHLARLEETWGD